MFCGENYGRVEVLMYLWPQPEKLLLKYLSYFCLLLFCFGLKRVKAETLSWIDKKKKWSVAMSEKNVACQTSIVFHLIDVPEKYCAAIDTNVLSSSLGCNIAFKISRAKPTLIQVAFHLIGFSFVISFTCSLYQSFA